MSGFLKRMENEIAYKKVGRGEGTGPISRILSGINLLALVYLLVYLFKDQQYIPLIILVVLGFTRFGHWVSIGLLIYFIVAKYWVGTGLILLYGGIGWLSVWFGVRNIKRNLYSGRANIDPFEGMADLLFILIFKLILFGVALLTSGIVSIIFWVLFGFVTLFEVGRYYQRLSSPWRKLHFPLMVHYSAIAGYLVGAAKSAGKEFNIKQALHSLIKAAYRYMEDDEINLLIESAEKKINNFSDREALNKLFQRSHPSLDPNKIEELMDKIETTLRNPEEKGLRIRYAIAEIVGREYGEHERMKYIYAVFTGQAN